MVRLAEKEDFVFLSKMFEEFNQDIVKAYKIKFDKNIADEVLNKLIKEKSVFVLETSGRIVGGMGGIVSRSILSADIFFCSMFFYVNPKYRRLTKQFIKDVETILKSTRVTRFVISNPGSANQKLDRYYSILGFERLETHYLRSV